MERPISQTQERIRERILDVMAVHGATRSEIARRAGVMEDTIRSILTGEHRSRMDTLADVEAALDQISARRRPDSGSVQDEYNRRALEAYMARRRHRAARSRVGTIK
ncbi:hypothetical protein [Nesterenkonia sp. K-15-9-6]|uniref:hypothetical protein n=1 Tax=Nesterenkonia sp. K-15-9-6 TaxID=3093918 RepID=UPI004043978A